MNGPITLMERVAALESMVGILQRQVAQLQAERSMKDVFIPAPGGNITSASTTCPVTPASPEARPFEVTCATVPFRVSQ